jgi:DNA-binding NtrC family response regulator
MFSVILPTPAILIVDDEPLIRWSLAEGLIEHGYVVHEAASRAEALSVAAAHAGEDLVVLLDLRLPDCHDLELVRELRERLPEAPVIVMSAHGSPETVEAVRALGVRDFVHKPFDVTTVTSLVGDVWHDRTH